MENENVRTVTKVSKNEIQTVAALLSGILGILFSSIWFLGLIHSIVAIVCGARMKVRHNSKMGKAGLVLGIIGTIFSTLILIFNILIIIYEYI